MHSLFAIAMLNPMPIPVLTPTLTSGYHLAMPTLAEHINNVHLMETGDQMWNGLLYADEIPFPITTWTTTMAGSHESHLSWHYMHTQWMKGIITCLAWHYMHAWWMKDPMDASYKGQHESHLCWHLPEFEVAFDRHQLWLFSVLLALSTPWILLEISKKRQLPFTMCCHLYIHTELNLMASDNGFD